MITNQKAFSNFSTGSGNNAVIKTAKFIDVAELAFSWEGG